uniref:Uncharacterized protein n=1 Tax=Stomoxys calcitrans TaxID=35570 RepID=A0A1I8Q7T6_STOCA
MDPSLVNLASNWTRVGGCPFEEILQVKSADPDVFLRPTLNELLNQDKAILLKKGDCTECFEIHIQLIPEYKIQAISFISNITKVEIFQGKMEEYLKTLYGTLEKEDDDIVDEDFKTYRYDLEVEKSGITDVAIKFLSSADEVCIFGIQVQIAPNPNGITTLVSNCINYDNVQSILQSSNTGSLASEKCTQLLNIFAKSKCPSKFRSESSEKLKAFDMKVVNEASSIQTYIDHRLNKMEERLNEHLTCIEKKQTEIVDCLIKLLEKLESK